MPSLYIIFTFEDPDRKYHIYNVSRADINKYLINNHKIKFKLKKIVSTM